MKLVFLIFMSCVAMSAFGAQKVLKVENITGAYVATDPNCHYKFAKIRMTAHQDFDHGLLVEVKGPRGSTSAFSHHFDLDQMGKIVKISRNSENLRIKNMISEKQISSETMGCLSDWLFCGPWNVDMQVEEINEKQIKISHAKNELGCTYSKIAITL